ncbi:uncharacterized protein N7503_008620 [Penicillium pulvis]|uniref:uncharacterized protein n=1 Tax=Penicillium pulvis TaxID=1562058 RepID=UPI0025483836|nr:uncharacterized protein N7503_008620 [Penicillium pulvis]KAJ5792642.1 hypothetical protein N7503_008620 [Penicillium pulvis]
MLYTSSQNSAPVPLDTYPFLLAEPFSRQNDYGNCDFSQNTGDETPSPRDLRFPGYDMAEVDGLHSKFFSQDTSAVIEDPRASNTAQSLPATRFGRFPWLNTGLSTGRLGARKTSYPEDGQISPKQSVEIGGLYSLSDCLSSFQQNNPWVPAPCVPLYNCQPLPDTKALHDAGSQASAPYLYHELAYETTDESAGTSCIGGSFSDIITDGSHVPSTETETFRFRTILQAPTAMTNENGDPPLTYLNKGQVYYLTIMDSMPPAISDKATTYRTFVRISFDQEHARSNPEAYWKLWKEGRGMTPEQQQEESLFALEYAGGDSPRFKIEQKCFDGFCVTWKTDSSTGFNACHIPICFNFLSTDFTRSKGVRGSPVRLCAKTEQQTTLDNLLSSPESEVCFCKLQVFRDHGAERKLSNDHGNLKRGIEKLKMRISNAELGWGSRKRKRGRSVAKNLKGLPPDCVSEQLSQAGLKSKLVGFERMSLSSRSSTLLALRGDKEDDPDLYPVRLVDHDCCIKPTPAEHSIETSIKSEESAMMTPTSSHQSGTETTVTPQPVAEDDLSVEYIKVNRIDVTDHILAGLHLTSSMHVQASSLFSLLTYLVACFYVRLLGDEFQEYYRAVYLSERTVRELVRKISEKYEIEPVDCFSLFHITEKKLKIMVDDEFVQQMAEGQNMRVELHQNTNNAWEMWLLY